MYCDLCNIQRIQAPYIYYMYCDLYNIFMLSLTVIASMLYKSPSTNSLKQTLLQSSISKIHLQISIYP